MHSECAVALWKLEENKDGLDTIAPNDETKCLSSRYLNSPLKTLNTARYSLDLRKHGRSENELLNATLVIIHNDHGYQILFIYIVMCPYMKS